MTREQKEQIDRINELTLNLCNDAYNKGFEAGTKTMQECSWEKGVRDAWEYITHMVDKYRGEVGLGEMKMLGFLHNLDPVTYTKDYVDSRNAEDLAKLEPIKVGDIVIASCREAVVTHISDKVASLLYLDNRAIGSWHTSLLAKTGKTAVVRIDRVIKKGELK